MRGYCYLKKSKFTGFAWNIARAFTGQELNINQKHFSEVIFGAGIKYAEIICRQYLLLRCAGLKMNRELLYSFGKPGRPFVFYLPLQWRNITMQCGVKVALLRMALIWNIFLCMMLAYGILTIAKTIFTGIAATCGRGRQQFGTMFTSTRWPPVIFPSHAGMVAVTIS